jgi:hypothetical protein
MLGLALLVLSAPALARGRNEVFAGEIDQPPLEEFAPHPKIELFVHIQNHRGGRLTIKIPAVNIFNTHYRCQNGVDVDVGLTHGSTSRLGLREIQVKKNRTFDQSVGFDEGAGHGRFTGTLPKHGSAQGTIELSEDLGTVHEPESEPINLGQCATGVLDWSATQP